MTTIDDLAGVEQIMASHIDVQGPATCAQNIKRARACPWMEDAAQRTTGGASLRSSSLRTLPNDSSSAGPGRLPSTSSSHGARGVLGLNAQRNQSMESYSSFIESLPSRASEAVWRNKAGGLLITCARLTLCSHEPLPPVCMSVHPEGKSDGESV
jgi:hypothetical protein